jgi:hypothetical protein
MCLMRESSLKRYVRERSIGFQQQTLRAFHPPPHQKHVTS